MRILAIAILVFFQFFAQGCSRKTVETHDNSEALTEYKAVIQKNRSEGRKKWLEAQQQVMRVEKKEKKQEQPTTKLKQSYRNIWLQQQKDRAELKDRIKAELNELDRSLRFFDEQAKQLLREPKLSTSDQIQVKASLDAWNILLRKKCLLITEWDYIIDWDKSMWEQYERACASTQEHDLKDCMSRVHAMGLPVDMVKVLDDRRHWAREECYKEHPNHLLD